MNWYTVAMTWHVVADGSAHLGLLGNVEVVDATPSEASSCYPVAPVAAHIVVLQHGLEPVGSLPPVHSHVQHQVAGNILPPPIRHEPCTTMLPLGFPPEGLLWVFERDVWGRGEIGMGECGGGGGGGGGGGRRGIGERGNGEEV